MALPKSCPGTGYGTLARRSIEAESLSSFRWLFPIHACVCNGVVFTDADDGWGVGGAQYNSGAPHRIIKMQDMPVDPMEPPKFR